LWLPLSDAMSLCAAAPILLRVAFTLDVADFLLDFLAITKPPQLKLF
jgi:hypothetical protein